MTNSKDLARGMCVEASGRTDILDKMTKFSWSAFPSSAKRGGCAINKMDPFRKRRGRGGQLGEIFRPKHLADLTTINRHRGGGNAADPCHTTVRTGPYTAVRESYWLGFRLH